MIPDAAARPSKPSSCDPYTVEQLVRSLGVSLERSSAQNMATPAEVLSAVFTMLDRTLSVMKDNYTPEDRNHNTKEVAKTLQGLMLDYGMVEN